MAASVAFLHQAEYEATLNEYEEEAKRQTGLHGQEERADGDDISKRISTMQSTGQVEQKLILQWSLLRGAGGGDRLDVRKSNAVANWLTAHEQGSAGVAASTGATAAPGLRYRGPARSFAAARTRPQRASSKDQPQQLYYEPRSRRRSVTLMIPALMETTANLRHNQNIPARTGLLHHIINIKSSIDSVLPIYSPDALLRRSWDVLVMVLVVWTAVTIPLSVSFGMPSTTEWQLLGYAITAIFAVDLVVNFRTAYHDHQGELVRDSAAIASHYMRMWFWVDLLGTIPFDSIVLWSGALNRLKDGNDGNNNAQLAVLGFLKAPRLLRLGRLLSFLDSFKNAKIFRIVQLFMAMLLISHWLACIWYMMYRFGGKDDADEWAFEMAIFDEYDVTWTGASSGVGGSATGLTPSLASITTSYSIKSTYVVTFYYSFLLMVGDNVSAYNNFERTFCILVLIAGTFFYSAVVGQMATLVATMNVAVNRHGQKLLMLQDALHYAGVPDKHREKVHKYYEYLQQKSHPGAEGMQFLQELPASLQLNLYQFLHIRSLHKVPLFQGCEEGFMNALTRRIRMISLSPREVIFRVGDAGKEMYVIKKGCVAVTSPVHTMWGLLQPGEVFGEVALLSTGKRTANCTALGFVDLAVLTGPDLLTVMRDYPISTGIIYGRAAARARALENKGKTWLDLPAEDEFFECEEPAADNIDDNGGEAEYGDDNDDCSCGAVVEKGDAVTNSSCTSGSQIRISSSDGSFSGDSRPVIAADMTPCHSGESAGGGSTTDFPNTTAVNAVALAILGGCPRDGPAVPGPDDDGGGRGSMRRCAFPSSVLASSPGDAQTPAPGPSSSLPSETGNGKTVAMAQSDSSTQEIASLPVSASVCVFPTTDLCLISKDTGVAAPATAPVEYTSSPEAAPQPPMVPTPSATAATAVVADICTGASSHALAPPLTAASSSGLHPCTLSPVKTAGTRDEAAVNGAKSWLAPTLSTTVMTAIVGAGVSTPSKNPSASASAAMMVADSRASRTDHTAAGRRDHSCSADVSLTGAHGCGGGACTTAADACVSASMASGALTTVERAPNADDIVWLAPRHYRRTRTSNDMVSVDLGVVATAAAGWLPSRIQTDDAARGGVCGSPPQPSCSQRPCQQASPILYRRRHLRRGSNSTSVAGTGCDVGSSSEDEATPSTAIEHFGPGCQAAAGQELAAAGIAVETSVTAGGEAAFRRQQSFGSVRRDSAGGGGVSSSGGGVQELMHPRQGAVAIGATKTAAAVATPAALSGCKDPSFVSEEASHASARADCTSLLNEVVGLPGLVCAVGASHVRMSAPTRVATLPSSPSLSTTIPGPGGGPAALLAPLMKGPMSPVVGGAPHCTSSMRRLSDRNTRSLQTTMSNASGSDAVRPSGIVATNISIAATPSTATSDACGGAGALPAVTSNSTMIATIMQAKGASILRLSRRYSGNLPPYVGSNATAAAVAEPVKVDDEELKWISTRPSYATVCKPGQLPRRGSACSLLEEELVALAPGGPMSPMLKKLPSNSSHSHPLASHSPLHVSNSRLHRNSTESIPTFVEDVPGGGGGSRRSSIVQITHGSTTPIQSPIAAPGGIRSRYSSEGQSSKRAASAPPPPPPPPDGVFVPRAAWNQLIQAVSRLSWFENVVQRLIDLVSEQDEALGRLEQRAKYAASLVHADNSGTDSIMASIMGPPSVIADAVAAAAVAQGPLGTSRPMSGNPKARRLSAIRMLTAGGNLSGSAGGGGGVGGSSSMLPRSDSQNVNGTRTTGFQLRSTVRAMAAANRLRKGTDIQLPSDFGPAYTSETAITPDPPPSHVAFRSASATTCDINPSQPAAAGFNMRTGSISGYVSSGIAVGVGIDALGVVSCVDRGIIDERRLGLDQRNLPLHQGGRRSSVLELETRPSSMDPQGPLRDVLKGGSLQPTQLLIGMQALTVDLSSPLTSLTDIA